MVCVGSDVDECESVLREIYGVGSVAVWRTREGQGVGGAEAVVNWGFVPGVDRDGGEGGAKVMTVRPAGVPPPQGEGREGTLDVEMDESAFLLATAWAAAWRSILPTV